MVQGVSSALSALQVLGKKIEVVANNVANATTNGFKKSRATSVDLSNGNTRETGGGTALGEISQSVSQGALVPTGSSTDLAISGKGFFVVKAQDGSTYYTRDGGFDLDQQGYLADSSGNMLQGWPLDPQSGEAKGAVGNISIPAVLNAGSDGGGSNLLSTSISPNGVLTGAYSDGTQADLFRIALARFPNSQGLEKIGNNLSAATGASGEAITGAAGFNGLGRIVPQALEESNVDPAEEMTQMMILQRSYEANLKVIAAQNEMTGDVLNIIS